MDRCCWILILSVFAAFETAHANSSSPADYYLACLYGTGISLSHFEHQKGLPFDEKVLMLKITERCDAKIGTRPAEIASDKYREAIHTLLELIKKVVWVDQDGDHRPMNPSTIK